ncbi:MAG: FG-GAP-like repeat-containing protein [Desulfobulbaceae bacterium]|nr:FG-GAP-like repeat-containing protein [Desulfobulbaceae bacterium]
MIILLKHILFLITAAVACLLIPAGLSAQEAGKAVAILPFHLNAPPDKEYLTEGIRDMLGSRLRTEVGARIIGRGEVQSAMQASGGQAVAANMSAIAEKVGADYLIYGTITALGGGISIDASVFSADSQQAEEVRNFYTSAITSDQVMGAIDTLSWDIIENLFGKKRPASLLPAAPQAPVQGEKSSFTTAHPDKTFMSSGGGFALRGGRNFVKTRNFNMDLRGFDIGDVDGDGRAEIIVADKSEVKVFKRDGTRLNLLGAIKMLVRYPVHAVNAADLNGNGRAEIYISAADATGPGSRAVEWDGTAFVDLFSEARWYVRPMEVPGTGLVLAGQAAGQLAVMPGIFSLTNDNGKLRKQERLPVPDGVNLFNFVFADLDGDGRHEIVAVDDSFKLRVIQNGTTTWKSEERFGGTKRFIGGEPAMETGKNPMKNDLVDAVGERFKEFFIPSRILVSDVDRDGVDDIILNRNPDTITTVAPRMIQYPNGTLVGLKWNGIGLEEMWRTRKIDGYVINYQVKSLAMSSEDITDDELFIGLMLNTGSYNPFSSDQATVVIYPFDFELSESN